MESAVPQEQQQEREDVPGLQQEQQSAKEDQGAAAAAVEMFGCLEERNDAFCLRECAVEGPRRAAGVFITASAPAASAARKKQHHQRLQVI